MGYRIYHRQNGRNPTFAREVVEDQLINSKKAFMNYEFGKIGNAFSKGGADILGRKLGYTSPPKFVQAQWNHQKEMQSFGIRATGVYSPADIAANNAGAKFYAALAKLSNTKISIAPYIDRSWNESVNCNKYSASVGPTIWQNLLVSRNWVFQMDTKSLERKINADCKIVKKANSYDVALSILGKTPFGSLSLTPTFRKDKNGLIEGLDLSGTWTHKGESGRLKISSSRECWIKGTWGTGQSDTNGGSCLLFM
ncbi:hypothetical protein [Roseibium sediminicola]|uniref:Uncharacterized protein n=1 Tax=Roseibium sediminicola TaxID=2933272 RepID=A0ABT0H2V0_9HYPH|nr:hypothetical protein [Roseibium sp. CAU 1639]MCK7616010.1 hypothetical protein [Roseibium sp. CAU 1639]